MKAAVYNTFNGAIEIKQVDDFVVTETEAIIEVRVEKPANVTPSCQIKGTTSRR